MRWIALLYWLGLCFGLAGVSGASTAKEVSGWYRGLARPSFAPADWSFGPVWILLYAPMAIAAWRIWESTASPLRTWRLGLSLVQLGLNFALSWIFFRQHAIGAALVEVLLLWALIGTGTLVFARVSSPAAWLTAPYWAWGNSAAVLNAAIWRLN